jgi:hypothetical protein
MNLPTDPADLLTNPATGNAIQAIGVYVLISAWKTLSRLHARVVRIETKLGLTPPPDDELPPTNLAAKLP